MTQRSSIVLRSQHYQVMNLKSTSSYVSSYASGSTMLINVIHQNTMALKLNVPSIDTPEAANSLKETILTSEPDAKVEVDAETKTVTVESQASEETFKELIVAAGHTIA